MGHARATDVCDCTSESVEDTLGCTITALLSVDGPQCVTWAKFWKNYDKCWYWL